MSLWVTHNNDGQVIVAILQGARGDDVVSYSTKGQQIFLGQLLGPLNAQSGSPEAHHLCPIFFGSRGRIYTLTPHLVQAFLFLTGRPQWCSLSYVLTFWGEAGIIGSFTNGSGPRI